MHILPFPSTGPVRAPGIAAVRDDGSVICKYAARCPGEEEERTIGAEETGLVSVVEWILRARRAGSFND